MGYEVRIVEDGDEKHVFYAPDKFEQVWMEAGLDLLADHGLRSTTVEADVMDARLIMQSESFRQRHEESQDAVLHFLDRLLDGLRECPNGFVYVDY